jgi:hypothetical protein
MLNDEVRASQGPPSPEARETDVLVDGTDIPTEANIDDSSKSGIENNVDEVAQLTHRYLEVCESVYLAAISNHDIKLAGQIAKSALSVLINAANQLGRSSAQRLALRWFERLASLYEGGSPIPGDISRTLRWASSAMIYVFGQDIQTLPEAE